MGRKSTKSGARKERNLSPHNIVHIGKVAGNINLNDRHHDDENRSFIHSSFRPAQLPAYDPGLMGRASEVAAARELLSGEDSPGGAIVFSGQPGVGKTALAVYLAHSLASSFPDAQLYVDLHGSSEETVDLEQIIEGLLRALGVSGAELSGNFDEKIGAYRSALASRRCLLVLDNVNNEEQVRALLPGSPGIATIITSRKNLAGLVSVDRHILQTLSQPDGVAVLEHVIGSSRVSAENQDAKSIADLCGGLPLALRISANKLRDRPNWTLRYYASRLQNKSLALQSLRSGDLAVRASFALSYEGLEDSSKSIFRRLAVIPASGASVPLISTISDMEEEVAEEILENLLDANLLLSAPEPGRYRTHDLMRVFALECLEADEGEDQFAKLTTKVVDWYRETVGAANRAIFEGEGSPDRTFESPQIATDWLEVELDALVEIVATAHEQQEDDSLIAVAGALRLFFERRTHIKSWLRISEYAVSSARRVDCKHCLISALLANFRAKAKSSPSNEGSLGDLEEAYRLAQDSGSPRGESKVLYRIGLEAQKKGKFAEAEKVVRRSLELSRVTKDAHQQGQSLMTLGDLQIKAGDELGAEESYRKARLSFLAGKDRHCQGIALNKISRLWLKQGRHEEATSSARLAVQHFKYVHDIHCLGMTYGDLADIAFRQKNYTTASELYADSCSCFKQVKDLSCWSLTLRQAAQVDVADGQPEAAKEKLLLAAQLKRSNEYVPHVLSAPGTQDLPTVSDM